MRALPPPRLRGASPLLRPLGEPLAERLAVRRAAR